MSIIDSIIDNKYKVISELGVGGMGEVYKGLDIELEREVAIKLLRPELGNRADIVERFRSEAKALGRLNHTNIVTVYASQFSQKPHYMILEFVKGLTLDSIILQEKNKGHLLDWHRVINFAIQALDGLEHAHRFNVIHRDIKPSNIMLMAGDVVKIMDFGIARILEKARLTGTGRIIGTLEYMSPEQIKGLETDARTDIYSLGIVLYEALTGHLPFEKGTDYELMQSQIQEAPAPFCNAIPHIPVDLEQCILRSLAKDPRERFASAKQFAEALAKVNANQISVKSPSVPETRLHSAHFNPPPANPSAEPEPKAVLTAQVSNEKDFSFKKIWQNYYGLVIASVAVVIGISLTVITLLKAQQSPSNENQANRIPQVASTSSVPPQKNTAAHISVLEKTQPPVVNSNIATSISQATSTSHPEKTTETATSVSTIKADPSPAIAENIPKNIEKIDFSASSSQESNTTAKDSTEKTAAFTSHPQKPLIKKAPVKKKPSKINKKIKKTHHNQNGNDSEYWNKVFNQAAP
jgi:serine/threonine protein kinase